MFAHEGSVGEMGKDETALAQAEALLRRKRYLEAARTAGYVGVRSRARQVRAERELTLIACGYGVLTPYQRDLLETFFVSGEKYCADRLCERYYKERSALYRDRKKALSEFAKAVYGT